MEDFKDASKHFDLEDTTYVSAAQLRHILTTYGEKLTPAEFDEFLMKYCDMDSEGQIGWVRYTKALWGEDIRVQYGVPENATMKTEGAMFGVTE